jgi:hypothetical protein
VIVARSGQTILMTAGMLSGWMVRQLILMIVPCSVWRRSDLSQIVVSFAACCITGPLMG